MSRGEQLTPLHYQAGTWWDRPPSTLVTIVGLSGHGLCLTVVTQHSGKILRDLLCGEKRTWTCLHV